MPLPQSIPKLRQFLMLCIMQRINATRLFIPLEEILHNIPSPIHYVIQVCKKGLWVHQNLLPKSQLCNSIERLENELVIIADLKELNHQRCGSHSIWNQNANEKS